MRIVTWNVNGQRTLRGYRPWYSMKSWAECLDHLEADMICFQEVKMTRKAVLEHRDMCLPEGYEAYYSLHPTKGYSGVSTFVKTARCQVQRAEMGLTGELVDGRRAADPSKFIGGYPDDRAPESPVYDVIDAEGRAVLVDCGFFVLFNLYCPNETDEGRRDYKMAFYHTLAERVDNLLRMGRQVVIVGDLNIAHLPIDHCDGVGQRTRDEHLDIHPARRWLDQFLAPRGEFHDVTRMHHPTRKFMYTCWDTVKDTRPCNYGVRIDYIFVSTGLLPWVKGADIQPNVFGSDHCPVFVDLHEEIDGADGEILRLADKLNPANATKRKAPALATCMWPEFVGRRIQSFFMPSGTKPKASTPTESLAKKSEEPLAQDDAPELSASAPLAANRSLSPLRASISPSATLNSSQVKVENARKRSQSQDTQALAQGKATRSKHSLQRTSSRSKLATDTGQSKLQSFFQSPKQAESPKIEQRANEPRPSAPPNLSSQPDHSNDVLSHAGLKRQVSGSESEPELVAVGDSEPYEDSGTQRVESALAWGSIFAPKEPPRCSGHNEPARPWTVNKSGPNHGRKFWMCARPVGDAGTGDPADNLAYRCSYWKWDSDIRKRQRRQDRDLDGSARSFHDVAGTAPRLASGERRGPEKAKERPMHKAIVPREKK